MNMQRFHKIVVRKNAKPTPRQRRLTGLTRLDYKLANLFGMFAPWFTWG